MSTFVELNPHGLDSHEGDALIGKNDDAVSYMLSFFLSAKRGTFPGDSDKAGIFDSLFHSSLHVLSNSEISEYKNQLTSLFGSVLTVVTLTIEPDYQDASWIITLQWRSKLTNDLIVTDIVLLTDLTPVEQKFSLISIPDTGENLWYFILAEQPTLSHHKLNYDEDTSLWTWANYALTNFTTSDPYYSQIVGLIG